MRAAAAVASGHPLQGLSLGLGAYRLIRFLVKPSGGQERRTAV